MSNQMHSSGIKSFKDLIVWQKSMALVNEIYTAVNQLPSSENFILRSQMLRAAISIPSNIAEGWRRKHRKDSNHFFNIALASAAELETQLLILNQQYSVIQIEAAMHLLDEIQRILNKMTIIPTS